MACGDVLRDHGAAYAEWAGGPCSGSGPLQVARAALLMPAPFATSPDAVRGVLVPLLETGLTNLQRTEASLQQANNRVGDLEAVVAAARDEASQLFTTATRLSDENFILREEAARTRAENTSLQTVTASAQRSESALADQVARLSRKLEEQGRRHSQLLDQEQRLGELVTRQAEELSRLRAEVAELRQRPDMEAATLPPFLRAVAAGDVDRRCRRTARQLLARL